MQHVAQYLMEGEDAMTEITRRGFLAAGVAGAALVGVGGFGAVTKQADRPYVRPPGTVSDAALVAACNRCQRCLQACPYGIVTPVPLAESLVAYGTPTVAFNNGYCDFCMKCVDACPTGALSYGVPAERDLGVAKVVKEACVAWDWSGCTLCKDECPVDGAITLDDHDRPVVHADYCDGCGRCEQVCPSASLRAYDATVESKGIVVVSRASEIALREGAVTGEELAAGRHARTAQVLPVHHLGEHPHGPAGENGGSHENA